MAHHFDVMESRTLPNAENLEDMLEQGWELIQVVWDAKAQTWYSYFRRVQ